MINEIQPKIKFQNIVQCPFKMIPQKKKKKKKKGKKYCVLVLHNFFE